MMKSPEAGLWVVALALACMVLCSYMQVFRRVCPAQFSASPTPLYCLVPSCSIHMVLSATC